jgi:hypothetical protein
MSNYFTIEDDNKWHEYVYDLRKIREEEDDNIYHQPLCPDAGSIREIQFYAWTGSGTHTFHFNYLSCKPAKDKELKINLSARSTSKINEPDVTTVRIKNHSPRALTLHLRLVGHHNDFEIPKEFRRIKIKAGAHAAIPVKFRVENPYRIMAFHARRRVYVQWRSAKETGLLMSAPVTVIGPLCVPAGAARCLHTPSTTSGRLYRPHHSPPAIMRTLYRAGTHLVANMGEVDHHYHVNIEREDDWLEVGYMVPPSGGGIRDSGGSGSVFRYPNALDWCESSGTFEIDLTHLHHLMSGNADDTLEDSEWFYAKRHVGHRNACIPDDRGIPDSETTVIQTFLADMEDWIRADGLVDCERYVEYWNREIRADDSNDYCNSRSFDDGGCWFNRGEPFPDMSYITARVGDGGLADDMLNALENLIIYTMPSHLPRTFRPNDEHFDPSHSSLCATTYGITYSEDPRAPGSFGEWIAICRDGGADDGTIMHELFHYAAREHYASEDRAHLVSYFYAASSFGWKPKDYWPDWV